MVKIAQAPPPQHTDWLVCESVRESLTALEPLLADQLTRGAPRLVRRTPELVARKGKRLRAALVLLAGSFGVRRDALIEAAMVPELLHSGSLIQDDIIDSADRRRGAPALYRVVGAPTASLFATRLYCTGFRIVTGLPVDVRDRAVRAARDLCHGQSRELRSQGDPDLSPADYRRIVAGKTASLFAVSAWLGARVSGASSERVRALEGFGRRFGMLYQMVDDLLDLFGDEEEIGKPTGGDLDRRVFTLPLVYWLADNREHTIARRLLRNEALSPDQSARLVRELRGSDAVSRVVSDIRTWTRGAEARLSSLPACPARDSLKRLLLSVAGLPDHLVSRVARRAAIRRSATSSAAGQRPASRACEPVPGTGPVPASSTVTEWTAFSFGMARSLPWLGDGVRLIDRRLRERLVGIDPTLVDRIRRHRQATTIAEGLAVVTPVLFGGNGRQQVDLAVALALILAAEHGQRRLEPDSPERSARILGSDYLLCEFMAVLTELPTASAERMAHAAEAYLADVSEGVDRRFRGPLARRKLGLVAWKVGVECEGPSASQAFAQDKIRRLLEAAELLQQPGVRDDPSTLRRWTEALCEDTCRLAGWLRDGFVDEASIPRSSQNLK